jgi:hypothetical protein
MTHKLPPEREAEMREADKHRALDDEAGPYETRCQLLTDRHLLLAALDEARGSLALTQRTATRDANELVEARTDRDEARARAERLTVEAEEWRDRYNAAQARANAAEVNIGEAASIVQSAYDRADAAEAGLAALRDALVSTLEYTDAVGETVCRVCEASTWTTGAHPFHVPPCPLALSAPDLALAAEHDARVRREAIEAVAAMVKVRATSERINADRYAARGSYEPNCTAFAADALEGIEEAIRALADEPQRKP